MTVLQNIDNTILYWIRQTFCSAFLDNSMVFITQLGNSGFLWILLALLMIIFGRGKWIETGKWGWLFLISIGITAMIANVILKPMVARVRPYDLLGFSVLVERLSDFSFPSGHTAAAFVGARIFLAMDKRWGIPMTIFACLMAFSRLYLGVHFPSDVLFGGILGWGITSIVLKGKIYFEKRRIIDGKK